MISTINKEEIKYRQLKKVIVTQNNLRVNRAGSQLLVIYKLCRTVEK